MNSSRSSKNNALSGELTILVSNVQSVLGSSACTQVLGGQPFAIGVANQIAAALPSGQLLAKAGLPTVGAQVTSLAFTSVLQDNAAVAGTLVEKVVNLELQAKKVVIPGETTPGTLGSQTITKEFPIAIWVDTGSNTIIACSQSVQSVPGAPTGLALAPGNCVDTTHGPSFTVTVPNGAAYVLFQPEARQSPFPGISPVPAVAFPNPNFSANPYNPLGFVVAASPAFPPIPIPNPTGFSFYATAVNSANQGTVSAAFPVIVQPAGTCP
jgi:hypothetical protein